MAFTALAVWWLVAGGAATAPPAPEVHLIGGFSARPGVRDTLATISASS